MQVLEQGDNGIPPRLILYYIHPLLPLQGGESDGVFCRKKR